MADAYVNADILAGKKANPALVVGAQVCIAVGVIEVAAADADGTIYRPFAALPPSIIPVKLEVLNDAITAGTDYDIGLFEPNGGAVVDVNAFGDAVDMSSARVTPVDLIAEALDIDKSGKKLYEIAGHTIKTRKEAYDIGVTGVTVGTAAGTIVLKLYYVQG